MRETRQDAGNRCPTEIAFAASVPPLSGLKRASFAWGEPSGRPYGITDLRMMRAYLDFEKPVAELEARIEELRKLAANGDPQAIGDEIGKLEGKAKQSLADLYANLTPWQKTMVARHPERPHLTHYLEALIEDFTPLAGDRYFGEDEAIVGGFGRFRGQSVCIMGQEKGVDTDSRLRHNFGMAKPEGYRKAVRLMEMADRFDIPVVSLVDTAGAYPGIGAEERGQAEAIAQSTSKGLEIGVPSVAIIIGEGGSGGAVAIATSNKVLMLEHSIYTVASPEASASILWRDSSRAQDAATNMKITAQDLLRFGVIDGIIKEPGGGAHRDPEAVIAAAGDAIEGAIAGFAGRSREDIRKARADKFLAIGRKL
jgi:acetyl-CoA carboxylase carboxyl transferase subunit alpha